MRNARMVSSSCCGRVVETQASSDLYDEEKRGNMCFFSKFSSSPALAQANGRGTLSHAKSSYSYPTPRQLKCDDWALSLESGKLLVSESAQGRTNTIPRIYSILRSSVPQ